MGRKGETVKMNNEEEKGTTTLGEAIASTRTSELIREIDAKNKFIATCLRRKVREAGANGKVISEEMLSAIAKCVDDPCLKDVMAIQEVAPFIADMAAMDGLSPDALEFAVKRLGESRICHGDLMALLTIAFEKGIPLEKAREIFQTDEIGAIVERLNGYADAPRGEREIDCIPEGKVGKDEFVEGLFAIVSSGKEEEKGKCDRFGAPYDEACKRVREDLHAMNEVFYSAFNEWRTDLEELSRIKASYRMQQRMIADLQGRLWDAENEIERLHADANEAEVLRERIRKQNGELSKIVGMVQNSIQSGANDPDGDLA